ncbi:glucoamylase family protein [Streptomyces sp. MAR4 CNX-425]|uniref:glucoamylase family protein n=1 Tax=Streptomyces sp. MAR4 CNX-425 TaxID=3406343 RepID=UPI003B50127B
MRSDIKKVLLAVAVPVTLVAGAVAPARAAPGPPARADGFTAAQTAVLAEYASATWKSIDAMTSPETGLPANAVDPGLQKRSRWTAPTPFGSYLWSATAAWRSGVLTQDEAEDKVERTLDGLAELPYHRPSGMFYRWYDPDTGDFREDSTRDDRFLSSVDNAWAATGLMVVRNAFPELRGKAAKLLGRMDFRYFYDPDAAGANPGGGLMHGGFYGEEPPAGKCTEKKGEVWLTCGRYGALGETRMATYVGMALGQIPPEAYFGPNRSLAPDNCAQEQKPTGFYREYRGVRVWEGAYAYRGMKIMPTWGGSMFEGLMANLFVPEEKWGTKSWGINHPHYVRAHIEHGMEEAGYGYWGFSPSNQPPTGYRAYGVDAIGMNPAGYTSDQEATTVEPGFPGCRAAEPPPRPEEYGDGVVTPHAAFLGLRYAPDEALANLANLRRDFPVYREGGFLDAVAVKSGELNEEHLLLDQGMVMASLGNALSGDSLREYFVRGPVTARLKPSIAVEEFAAAPRP